MHIRGVYLKEQLKKVNGASWVSSNIALLFLGWICLFVLFICLGYCYLITMALSRYRAKKVKPVTHSVENGYINSSSIGDGGQTKG